MANYRFNFSPQLNNHGAFWRIISFLLRLVAPLPKAPAVRGVFTARPGGERGYAGFA